MTRFQSKPEYLFTKDLAAHIVYAEAKHFDTECSIHGPSEEEVRTLTRRLSYLLDRDLHWADLDEILDQVREIRHIGAGNHEGVRLNDSRTIDNRAYLIDPRMAYLRSNIEAMVSGVRPRYEVAA